MPAGERGNAERTAERLNDPMPTENQYPPPNERPADFMQGSILYRFDFTETYGREIWTAWTDISGTPRFQDYACRWPDGSLTVIPRNFDLEEWIAANTKKP